MLNYAQKMPLILFYSILTSIYVVTCFQEPRVTLAYLEPWYIQNLRNTENPLKDLRCNVFFFMNLDIYTIKYFIQNPL